jgi:uncharacterized membrane protein (UPF0127 family)
MRLFNQTRGSLVLEDLKIASLPWQKLKGLLFTKHLEKGRGLLLKNCASVHTIGMNYGIDLIFLDSRLNVVRIVKQLRPNRLSPWVGRASLVVEVPAGYCDEVPLSENDRLEIVP